VAIQLQNVALTDQIAFPGTVNMPATVSFNIVFSRTGPARHIAPKSRDPIGPFNWLGDMSPATNSGTFSVAYNDGSFSAHGQFDSAGNFGEIGTERNGSLAADSDSNHSAATATNDALHGGHYRWPNHVARKRGPNRAITARNAFRGVVASGFSDS